MINRVIAKEHAPIYILLQDDDYFRIMNVTYSADSNVSMPIKSFPSLLELFQCWRCITSNNKYHCKYKEDYTNFYILYFILYAGEKEQRTFHSRIINKNTTNIKYHVEKVRKYLKDSFESAIRQEIYAANPKHKWDQKNLDKEVKKQLTMLLSTPKDINEIINRAIKATKDEMGFPKNDPVEYSYLVTDAVIAAATSEPCKEYLNSQKPRPAIFPNELKNIIQTLQSKYSEDSELVIAKIKETKSREHIAAFSITSEKDQTLLNIVNMQRQHIKMEAWKFLALVERAGESLRLTELSKPKMGEPPPIFKFNNNTEGMVIGKFDIQNWIFDKL